MDSFIFIILNKPRLLLTAILPHAPLSKSQFIMIN